MRQLMLNNVKCVLFLLESWTQKPFLIELIDLECTNSSSISQAINKCLFDLFDGVIPYENLYLILSDAASYMIKCCKDLNGLFPNILHCTCLAHGLMRVAEVVRYSYPLIDALISESKKIFVKCGRRRSLFRQSTSLPLPPQPVISRWSTWLEAVFYYADNYEPFKEFVSNLCNENEAIKKVKEILRDEFVPQHLSFIASNFKVLTSAIKKLEGRLALVDAISIVNDVHLQLPRGVYRSKLDDVCN